MYMQIKCKHQAHGKVPNYPLVLQRLGWLTGRHSDCKWGWAAPPDTAKAWLLQRGRKRINPTVTCHFKRRWGAIEKSVPDAVKSVIITEQRAPLSFSRQHPQEILLCNQGKRCNQAHIQASFRNSPCRQHKGFSMVLCEVGDQCLGSATASRVKVISKHILRSPFLRKSRRSLGRGVEGLGQNTLVQTVLSLHCPHLWAHPLQSSVWERKFLADWQCDPEWADMNNLIWLLQQLSLQNLHGEGSLGFFSHKY